ncbi:MAG: Fic family protein [Selenomonadaceae bacterium]|nr:Fic family protein [Selenomonadaceae bacterium]
MREYNYKRYYEALLTPEIVSLLSAIHEFKGEQNLFIEAQSDTLSQLLEVARIQSTEASNKIEGIYTSDDRLKKIMLDKTMPKSRSEREIAGYRDVLATIHESHDYISPKVSVILQLHRDLYKFSGMSIGGNFKDSDNVIAEEDVQGNRFIRFQPVTSWETHESVNRACNALKDALAEPAMDNLLIIPMFILDFLCIHPFNDGNGRMSRLLTLLLLYRSGYIVGKYISIERMIEQSKDTYYETLQLSSAGWHEEEIDYIPFVQYMLGVIVAAYREFSLRVKLITTSGISKPERVRAIIRENLGKITKADIMAKCPDISLATVQRTLAALQKNGEIIKTGSGRSTAYLWNQDV